MNKAGSKVEKPMGRWQHIESLFQQASQLAAPERGAFLAGACRGDGALLAEVVSLLEAHEQADEFLEEMVDGEARLLVHGPEGESGDGLVKGSVGGEIGAYRVLRHLGSGGMSSVFLAARTDESLHRQVAIKVIKRGMDTAEVERRFRQERQILASLDHPHIARLIDAATTREGQPAFVMEYIEGLPIDQFCDRHELGLVKRIELFRTVCSAVHYAHRNLVVHRDLKPSNLLVMAGGEPKLLDFGIAKVMAPEAFPQTVVATAAPGRVMTPAYASPEQVRGGSITTASDIYSLGVLLYELLTGAKAHRFSHAGPGEIERVICEQPSQLPSAAALEAEEKPQPRLQGVASAEGGKAALARKLVGDLDNILLMALRKEPDRRYASAEQFSEDLHRYLRGLPVLARKDTARYRASKFVRRHRASVAAVVVTAMVIVGSAVAAVHQARVAEKALAQADLERKHLQQMVDFVISLFEVTDPSAESGQSTVAGLLGLGVERSAEGLADQPKTQAKFLTVLGSMYNKQGLYDKALTTLEEAAGLLENRLGEEDPELVATLNELGFVLYYKAQYEQAETVYRRSLTLQEETGFGDVTSRMATLNGLALVLNKQGDRETAKAIYQQALELSEREDDTRESLELAEALNGLALVLHDQGASDRAEPLFRRALAIRRRLQGTRHQEVASVLHNLATVRYRLGDHAEAGEMIGEALSLRRELLGDEHPEVVRTLNTLAGQLFKQGKFEEAEALYRELVPKRRRLLGDDHPDVAKGLNNLAKVRSVQGDLSEAERLYRESLLIKRRLAEKDYSSLAVTLHGLAVVLEQSGNQQEAEALFREALVLRRQDLVAGHPRIAETLLALGKLLCRGDDPGSGQGLLREAAEIYRDAKPPHLTELGASSTALEACGAGSSMELSTA